MDDELNEQARRFFDGAMAQDVPPDVVVEDSWGMVISRVSADTERSSEPPVADAREERSSVGLHAVVAVVVAAFAIGGLWLVLRPSNESAPTTTPSPVRATKPPAPVRATTPAARVDEDLLDEAEAAIARDPVHALELVDRHAVAAPTIDPERRMTLRIEALCALRRDSEAAAEASAFLAKPRADEWRQRVLASCGAPGDP